MRILKYYIFTTLCFFVVSMSAQKQNERRADEKLAEQNYEDAIERYSDILQSKPDVPTEVRVNHKLADVYYELRNYDKSMVYYRPILTSHIDSLNITDACRILNMLNRMSKTTEAEKWASEFAKNDKMMDNQQFRNLQRSIMGVTIPILDDTLDYHVQETSLSTKFSDFWTGELDSNTIIFIRSNAGNENSASTMFTGSRFYLYNKLSKKEVLYGNFPVVCQAGPATFYKGHQVMIYTDNNLKSGFGKGRYSSNTQSNLQLVYATYNEDKKVWKRGRSAFVSNKQDISYCHPCLTNNDKTLIFASNMPGGYGGTDIYKSDWNEAEKKWGEPVNLGPTVNTAGNELYPSVRGSVLYFTSDGHLGFGGYDIYAANLTQDIAVVDTNLIYLPEPINTRFNDFSLFLNNDNRSGYFTSDRNGGKGIDDIYAFSTTVKHKPQPIVPVIEAPKGIDSTDVIISIVKEEELTNVYFDFDKSNIKDQRILEDALQEMQKPEYKNVSFLLLGSADARGAKEYNDKLSDRRAKSVKKWLVEHGFDENRLVTQARGAISLSDKELRELVGIKTSKPISDADVIRKAYKESRRVVIKTIVPREK